MPSERDEVVERNLDVGEILARQPVVHVFLSSGAVTIWVMGVAVYSLLRPDTGHLSEIFA